MNIARPDMTGLNTNITATSRTKEIAAATVSFFPRLFQSRS